MSVPTGTKVFDWIVPQEWFVKQAYIISPNGKKYVIFQKIIFILLVIAFHLEAK